MLAEISEQITQLTEKRRQKGKIERDLFQVQRSLKEKLDLLASLEREMQAEQVDVERLEGLSLKGLFYSVLGSKEEQLDQQRQEFLAAQLKYQQAKRAVDALRADQGRLESQLRELVGIEAHYKRLLSEKETLLRQANPQMAAELYALSEQIANRGAEKREIQEAITAAGAVLASLDQVIDSLQSAEGWGTWDMLGGGMLSTAIKHSRIDDARRAVDHVQDNLTRFTRELADVQRAGSEIQIDISGLDTFADFFFDGLIMDWIVQSKIENALGQARMARERVSKAEQDLVRLRKEAERQAELLTAQRAERIERA